MIITELTPMIRPSKVKKLRNGFESSSLTPVITASRMVIF